MSRLRLVRRALLLLTVVAAVAGLGLWALVSTEPGLRLAWRVASPLLPSSIAVDGVRGRVVGPLEMEGLSFTTNRVRIAVQSATIDWQLGPFFSRVLDVRAIDASSVTVELRDSGPARRPAAATFGPSPISLPVEIRINEATVRGISLAGLPDAAPQSLDSVALTEGAYRSELTIGALEVWGPDGWVRIDGRLRTQGRYPFAFEVHGSVRPPEPYGELELEAQAEGDLDTARLDVDVARPLGLLVAGELRDLLGARVIDADVTVDETDFRAVSSEAPDGRARATLHAVGPVDSLRVTGSGRVSTPETGAVDLEVDLERRPDRVLVSRLVALLDATRLDAAGTVHLGAEEPGFDGQVGWSEARWPLLGEPRLRSQAGSAILEGGPGRYTARLDGALELLGARPLAGRLALVGTGSTRSLEIDTLELDMLGGTLRLDGSVSWQPDLRWRLAFQGEGLQPEAVLSDTARYEVRLDPRGSTEGELVADRISGSLTLDTVTGVIRGDSVSGSATAVVTGTTRAYRGRVGATLNWVGDPDLGGMLVLVASGTSDSLRVDSLGIAGFGGTLRAEGQVAWSDGVRWGGTIDADELQLGRVLPDATWHDTRLGFRGSVAGERAADRLSAAMAIDTLTGELLGQEVGGTVVAEVDVPFGPDGPRLEEVHAAVERVDLAWQQARLEASGVVRDTVDLSLRLSLPDLSVAAPEARGRAEVNLRALGPRAQPTAELTMEAYELVLDSAAASPPILDSVTVALSGTPGSHDVELHAGRREGTVDLALRGSYADRGWSGTLQRLELADSNVGPWSLERSVDLAAHEDSVVVEQACLRQEASRACAAGLWRAGGTSSAEVVLEELTGRRLAELLPPGWAISGQLGARAAGTLEADGTLRAEGLVDLGSGTIELGRGASARRLTYSDLGLDVAVDEAGARLSMATALFDETGAPAVSAEVEVALPGYQNVREPMADQRLTGHVRSSIPDLSAFRYALPDLEPVGGSVDVDLRLGGSVADAEVEGEARVQEGAVDLPRAGLQLRDIEVLTRGRGADGIELDVSVGSGGGTLSIQGRAPVGPTESDPARIVVSGTRVRALDLPDATVWVSPDLELTAWPDGLRVSGEVVVPVARIELTEIPATAIRASDDVVFVDDTTSLSLGRAVSYSVRLTLGDSITFRGFGLSAEPLGSLALSHGPGGAVMVRGDITLEEGRYQAYGQELTMERGRLLFVGGPPDDPGLDIRASRTASDGTVAGLEVRGTLKDPEVTIFSEPAMMESQALAYIVLGRPMSSGSEDDGSRVSDAAIALGLQRGNEIATRLGRSLGLDEMTVEAGGTLEEASLVAGTYVAPDLYVSYGVGLFEPVSIFRIRYMLSRRWTVRAETGKANSADLLYRFERGR